MTPRVNIALFEDDSPGAGSTWVSSVNLPPGFDPAKMRQTVMELAQRFLESLAGDLVTDPPDGGFATDLLIPRLVSGGGGVAGSQRDLPMPQNRVESIQG